MSTPEREAPTNLRSLARDFLLQIGLLRTVEMRRETSRVSFLMCPFCVRGWLLMQTTLARSCAARAEAPWSLCAST